MDILEHDKSPYLLKEIHLATRHWRCNTISVANNGTMIAVGHPGFNVRYALVIDTVIGSEIRTIHVENGIYSAKITPDGSKVIIGDVDNDMTIWDIRSPDHTIPMSRKIDGGFKRHDDMILTSDGKRAFMLARYGCDSILDLETGIIKMGVVFDFGLQHFNVALSSDDQIFAVLGLDSNGGTIITLIDAVNGSHLRVQSFNDSIFSLSNTTAPRDFWLEMNDSYSTVWNTEKNICYNSIDITKETIRSYIISRDQKKIVVKCPKNFLWLHQVDANAAILDYKEHEDILDYGDHEYNYALSGDGRVLWTRDQYTIRMYDMNIDPFWSCSRHSKFRKEMREIITILYYANNVRYGWHGARESPFYVIPREICRHIFSFIRRDW